MAPYTQEQKRIMRIARKKRKKLQRREARKADQLRKFDAQTQADVDTINEEACRNRKLANKYYSMWRQCTKEKRNTAKLCDKKCETVWLCTYPPLFLNMHLISK